MAKPSLRFVYMGLLGGITLAASSTALAQPQAPPPNATSEVVVTAERPNAETQIDRQVYKVSTNLQKTSLMAADLLNQIPSVDVDSNSNIALRGDPNVTILIDGKPSAQFSGSSKGQSLQQFPASEIDRIEVMHNPPAQYKAEGSGGIINIITKKNYTAGISGSVRASGGPDDRFIIGGNLVDNFGKLKISGSVFFRQDTQDIKSSDDLTLVDPTSGERYYNHEAHNEEQRRLVPSFKIASDYDVDDTRSIGGSFDFRELTGRRSGEEFYDTESNPGVNATSTDRLSDGHENNIDGDAELHFEQKLNKSGETLNISLQRGISDQRQHYNYTNLDLNPPGVTTLDQLGRDSCLTTTELNIDYHLPMANKYDLKLGADIERDDFAFDTAGADVDPSISSLISTSDLTSHFSARQQVNAAYGVFRAPWGKWTLQIGVRIEATNIRTNLPTGATAGNQNYLGVYPSLHLSRPFSDRQTLNLSVTRRVTRPDLASLNPFLNTLDIHSLRVGNPDLNPQDTWAYQLAYEYASKPINWSMTGYFRESRDILTILEQSVSDDVIQTTLENLPYSRFLGLETTASGKLGATLSYNVSLNPFYTGIDTSGLGIAGDFRSKVDVSGKVNLDWQPTASDTMQISFSRTGRRLIPQGYIGAYESVNVGYERKLSPQLSLVGTVTDLFDTRRSEDVIMSMTLDDDSRQHQIGRVSYIGLLYTFGDGKKKADKFEYDP